MTSRAIYTREQLLHLLAEAAEFEHNLLCCYLYAAFSLKRGANARLSVSEAEAVERWHGSIMAVAIEEMTHLALVANLTVAVGARPHFDRPNLPVAPGYHPADVVVELAGFSMDTLDHFIFLERPEGFDIPDGASFQRDFVYERGERPGAALMPAAHDYGTVAELYEAIRTAFTSLAETLGEKRLFVGPAASQVATDVTKLDGLTAATDLRSALQAVDTIVVQGEGSTGDTSEDSHFSRFVAIKHEYEKLLAENAGFNPAWPAARNPIMRALPGIADRVYVAHPASAALLDLGNAVYNQMLRMLAQAWGRSDPAIAAKRKLIEGAMKMMGIVRVVGEQLATLPAGGDHPGVNAGMSFAMFRATEGMCETGAEWQLAADRIDELARGVRAVAGGVASLESAADQLEQLSRTMNP